MTWVHKQLQHSARMNKESLCKLYGSSGRVQRRQTFGTAVAGFDVGLQIGYTTAFCAHERWPEDAGSLLYNLFPTIFLGLAHGHHT